MQLPENRSHHSLRRGAPLVAPLLFFAIALILGGCAGNIREVTTVSKEMAKALVDQASSEGLPTEGAVEETTVNDAIANDTVDETPVENATASAEQPVTSIPMAAPLNQTSVELSGMAWHGDKLILLPQFPSRSNRQIYALDRAKITAYLRGELDAPLTPQPIAFDDGAIHALVQGFDGFEAIAFDGDNVFLTIESRSSFGMLGVLVSGEMAADGATLALNPFDQASIPVQAALSNMSDESLFVAGDEVVTIYEANGGNTNPDAVVHRFDKSLKSTGVAPMTNIEYRITDVTALDADNRFWAINYLWPGDVDKLRLADDPLLPADRAVGNGDNPRPVERLVEFQWSEEGVTLTGAPPIQLRLLPGGISRNWEGVVRFQDSDLDGFLLVTDEFPSTMLGYVGKMGVED